MWAVVIVIVIFDLLLFLGQGVGEKDEEDVTTALTIDVPKVSFFTEWFLNPKVQRGIFFILLLITIENLSIIWFLNHSYF